MSPSVATNLTVHGRADLDNYATPNTPDTRINLAAQAYNLWQLGHEVGVTYGFTPERTLSTDKVPDWGFNQPVVAYCGLYYRVPLFEAEPALPTPDGAGQFGYSEPSHRLQLPPPQSIPDFTLFASGFSQDTGLQHDGPRHTLYNTNDTTLTRQDFVRNIVERAELGGRYTQPLWNGENAHLSGFVGAEFKHYRTQYQTTATYIQTVTVVDHISDPSQWTTNTSTRVINSAAPWSTREVNYVPLSLGLDYVEEDTNGVTLANAGATGNWLGDDTSFSHVAYSSNARARFVVGTLSLQREQYFLKQWSVRVRANAQAADSALINDEQYALGGVHSVRGYYEGDTYGDAGWSSSVEINTPAVETGLPLAASSLPVWLRSSIFSDIGQRYLMEPTDGEPSTRTLLGTGVGVSADVAHHFLAAVVVGWPLFKTANTDAGSPRASFIVQGSF